MPDITFPGSVPAPADPERIGALAAELAASPLGLTPILAPAELGRL